MIICSFTRVVNYTHSSKHSMNLTTPITWTILLRWIVWRNNKLILPCVTASIHVPFDNYNYKSSFSVFQKWFQIHVHVHCWSLSWPIYLTSRYFLRIISFEIILYIFFSLNDHLFILTMIWSIYCTLYNNCSVYYYTLLQACFDLHYFRESKLILICLVVYQVRCGWIRKWQKSYPTNGIHYMYIQFHYV